MGWREFFGIKKGEHTLVTLIRSEMERLEDSLSQQPKVYDSSRYNYLIRYFGQAKNQGVAVPPELTTRYDKLKGSYRAKTEEQRLAVEKRRKQNNHKPE